jgi:alpha-galactosidase
MADLARFAGPGGWNDPDMLVVGLNNSGYIKGGGCTDVEYSTQMSMWSMFSAPLMIGCDVRKMSEGTGKILLNKNIIAIDQDPLGKQGFRVFRRNGLEAWKKQLSDNKIAIAVFNRSEQKMKAALSAKDMELEDNARYTYNEIGMPATQGKSLDKLTTDVASHETRVFILAPLKHQASR